MSEYFLTIGVEVHVQVDSKTKLYCGCKNDSFFSEPNTNICPICTAQPGALPQVNKEVVRKAILLGKALKSTLNTTSRFDRKSYFYPDNPSGFQITQYKSPILSGGFLSFSHKNEEYSFPLLQVQIENDAGKLIHTEKNTLIDFNRAGSPLFEIITPPCFHRATEVILFLKELQKLLRYLKISSADMEKGQMRVDVNVSVSPRKDSLGNRREIKNMNSFSEIEKAILYEYEKQQEQITAGKEIFQETFGFDPKTGKTFVQRSKENSADYRYFPEPDIPILVLLPERENEVSLDDFLLPQEVYKKFREEYHLSLDEASLLSETPEIAEFFENTVSLSKDPKKSANWILSELFRYLNEKNIPLKKSPLPEKHIAEIINAINSGEISGKIAKEVFAESFHTQKSPADIIKNSGLKVNSNEEELISICKTVLEENKALVQEYKNGKDKLFGAFVGQVMKKTQGKGNPVMITEILKKELHTD